MTRFAVVPWLLALACASCLVTPTPKPQTSLRAAWVAKVERVQDGGAKPALQRCALDGKVCQAVAPGTELALPGRLVTSSGVRAATGPSSSAASPVHEGSLPWS